MNDLSSSDPIPAYRLLQWLTELAFEHHTSLRIYFRDTKIFPEKSAPKMGRGIFLSIAGFEFESPFPVETSLFDSPMLLLHAYRFFLVKLTENSRMP